MRKHFLGVLIICFLSVFSVLSFAKRSGPLTAEASIYKKRSQTVAKAKVQATVSARHGAWAISAVSGRKSDGDAGHYRYGLSTQFVDPRDYTSRASNARASAWISGHDRHGKAWFVQDSKPSGV